MCPGGEDMNQIKRKPRVAIVCDWHVVHRSLPMARAGH